MSSVQPLVSDMLITVKSREVQRGLFAEMRGGVDAAARHFLAAAHLELVLANDYEQAGEPELARRSRLSAASCFWRAGRRDQAQPIFDAVAKADPSRADEVQEVRANLNGGDSE
jgi:hypothetical protein